MNIRNKPPGPLRSESTRSDGPSDAKRASQAGGASGKAPAKSAPASQGDHVEISDAARLAQTGRDGDAALVERGRQALDEGASLSSDRLAELKQRVADGRYTNAEATRQVAEQLAGDLGGASGK